MLQLHDDECYYHLMFIMLLLKEKLEAQLIWLLFSFLTFVSCQKTFQHFWHLSRIKNINGEKMCKSVRIGGLEKVCFANLVHLPPPKVYLATFLVSIFLAILTLIGFDFNFLFWYLSPVNCLLGRVTIPVHLLPPKVYFAAFLVSIFLAICLDRSWRSKINIDCLAKFLSFALKSM